MDWQINFKNITVKMSDGKIHSGKVNIRHFSRLSDFLKNKNDDFIVLVSDDGISDSDTLMLNKNYIIEVKEASGQETIRFDDAPFVDIWGQLRN